MAVNFGDTIMEGGITPSAQVQAPVQDQSMQYLVGAADTLAQGAGSIFGQMVRGAMDAQGNSVLNSYRMEMTQLADAVDQGALSVPAARGRIRQLYAQYIANNPGLADDLDKLNSTLMSHYGIGSVIQEGNEQTRRIRDLEDQVFAAGWVREDGTPDVDGFLNLERAVRRAEHIQREISTRAAVRGEVTAIEQEQLMGAIRDMAAAGYPWVGEQVARASQMIDEGADPAEVVANLRRDVNEQINQFTVNSGGEDISYIVDPMRSLLDEFESMVNGDISREMYETRVTNINAINEYMLMMNPEFARGVAVSKLLGQNASAVLDRWATTQAMELFARNLAPYDPSRDDNPTPSDIVTTDGNVGGMFEILEETMENGLNNITPELEAEVISQLTNALRSIVRNRSDSPRDYSFAMDFFSGETLEKWIERGNLIIPSNLQNEAREVIRQQYEEVLLPLVHREWHNALTSLVPASGQEASMGTSTIMPSVNPGATSPSEYIDVVWNGGSVSFRPKPGFENDINVRTAVNQLNEGENGIAAPLNTLIRAKAHMAGSTDYNAEWEFIANRVFGIGQEGTETATGQEEVTGQVGSTDPETISALEALEPFSDQVNATVVGSEGSWYVDGNQELNLDTLASLAVPEGLSLSDFNSDLPVARRRAEDIISATSANDPARMMNATSPLEVAAGYLGLSEERDQDNITLSRFIRNAAGIDINPAKTAWCAAFVDAVLHKSGLGGGTGKLNARSYLNWGRDSSDNPARGDLVVLWRGSRDSWQGHVGFFHGYDDDGNVLILGGNQSNSVNIQPYPADRVLGFRRAA